MEPAVQNSSGISRTCIYTAAGRAVGAREPDPAEAMAAAMAMMRERMEAARQAGSQDAAPAPDPAAAARMREQQRLSAYQLAEAVVAAPA